MKKLIGILFVIIILAGVARADYWSIYSTLQSSTTKYDAVSTGTFFAPDTSWSTDTQLKEVVTISTSTTLIPVATLITITTQAPVFYTYDIQSSWFEVSSTLIAGLNPHPRIYITPKVYSAMTNQVVQNTLEWQNLQKYTTSAYGIDLQMVNQALCYQALKEINYSKATAYGWASLSNLSTMLSRPKPSSANVTGWTLERISLVFDWTHDLMPYAIQTQTIEYCNSIADLCSGREFAITFNILYKEIVGYPAYAYTVKGERTDDSGNVTSATKNSITDNSKSWACDTGTVSYMNDLWALYDNSKSWTAGKWEGSVLLITAGNSQGESRQIYKSANNYLYVYPDFDYSQLPNTKSQYKISPWIWSGIRIVSGKGAGQTRIIINATANSLIVDKDWDIIPDTTSRYVIDRSDYLIKSADNRFQNIKKLQNDDYLGEWYGGYAFGGEYDFNLWKCLTRYLRVRESATNEQMFAQIPNLESRLKFTLYNGYYSQDLGNMQFWSGEAEQYPQAVGSAFGGDILETAISLSQYYPNSGKYIAWMMNTYPSVYTKLMSAQTIPILFITKPFMPQAQSPVNLPTNYFTGGKIGGSGIFDWWLNWSYPTTVISGVLGDVWTGGQYHFHQGHFNIYSRGGHLLIDSGKYNGSADWCPYETQGIAHQQMIFKVPKGIPQVGEIGTSWATDSRRPIDGGQTLPSNKTNVTWDSEPFLRGVHHDLVTVKAMTSDKDWSIIRADITNAYPNPNWYNIYPASTLSSFTPIVQYIKQNMVYLRNEDVLVILKQVKTMDKNYQKVDLFHTIFEPQLSGNIVNTETPGHIVTYDGSRVTITAGKGKAVMDILNPSCNVTKIGGNEINRMSISLVPTNGQVTCNNSSNGEIGAGRMAWYKDAGGNSRHGINIYGSAVGSTFEVTASSLILRVGSSIKTTLNFSQQSTLELVESAIDKTSGFLGNFRAGFRYLINGNNYPTGQVDPDEAGNWRYEATPKTASQLDNFLYVISMTDSTNTVYPTSTLVYSQDSSLIGARIQKGATIRTVMFSQDTDSYYIIQ